MLIPPLSTPTLLLSKELIFSFDLLILRIIISVDLNANNLRSKINLLQFSIPINWCQERRRYKGLDLGINSKFKLSNDMTFYVTLSNLHLALANGEIS